MTKKQLEDLGVSKEQAESILKINEDDVKNAKVEAVSENQSLRTEVSGLKTQVVERDKQLESLKLSSGDNEAMKKQIEDLQKENTTAKEKYESEMNQLKVDFAVEKALTGAKAKNVKAVRALLDLADAKLDKEGNVKGLQEQIEKLVSADDTKFLFDTTQPTFKGFQPEASAQQKPEAKVDVSKMSYEELTAYMESNPDADV
ncbi:MAG: phage scaffolding protein [Bacteroidales bacterium]|nr:phage scaffolding protein [Lachnoclostridium sp.]MCM1385131.1 phage scaffolding protein [Lachnoclostridium sp.]MCM1465533.1 phage scaffolding protein [Bacteroidales bacterium]